MYRVLFLAVLATAIGSLSAGAVGQVMDSHKTMQDGTHKAGQMMQGAATAGATSQGVINSVDPSEGVVNVTHGPIPSLSWPEMTMDLPVTEAVDLGDLRPGATVRFRVHLGPDQVYRIVAIDPAP